MHAVYRPPSYDFPRFLLMKDAIITAQGIDASCVIVGDLNVSVNQHDSTVVREYCNLLNRYNFAVTNSHITRPVSNNILDHVVCSESVLPNVVNETILTDISDHYPIISTFKLSRTIQKRELQKTVVYNQKLNEAFRSQLETLSMNLLRID